MLKNIFPPFQTSDEAPESHNNISFPTQTVQSQPATNVQNTPQYTLTLDGNSLKSGQIQYKIENTAIQAPQQAQLIVKNSGDSQVAQTLNALSAKKNVVIKKVEEPKDKKPKFNFILQASPQKPKITPITISPNKPATIAAKPQIQIQNIEKIVPAAQTGGKQLVVPFMVRNDGQIVSHQLPSSPEKTPAKNSNQIAYVQMKIAPNSDGQFTLTPAQPQQQLQHLQLSLSPQQLQQLNFQSQNHAASTNIQPQFTVTHVSNSLQEQSEAQTQTNKIEALEEEEVDFVDSFEAGDYYMEDDEMDEVEDKPETKKSKSAKTKKMKIEICSDGEENREIDPEQLEAAKAQLQQLVNLNTKKSDESADKTTDMNLTICDVCKKVFKKKEFLMQHLKSHIGLRPFKVRVDILLFSVSKFSKLLYFFLHQV